MLHNEEAGCGNGCALEIDLVPDESWNGLIEVQQVRQTVDRQVPGSHSTDETLSVGVAAWWR